MEVIKYDDSFGFEINKSIVSIGNYDGVHLGHQLILKELTKKSIKSQIKSIVATFEPHPKKIFSKSDRPFLLSNFDEKARLIDKFPVDCLVYFEFNESFASISAHDFVKDILVDKFRVSEVIVGYNFNFGKGRLGDAGFLREMGEKHKFKVTIVNAKEIGGETISSSYIRNLISSGDVKKAALFLGRNYSMVGEVVKGKNVGKEIGFPTVNLNVHDKIIPKDGVYSVLISVMGRKFKGVSNIGYQPTFGDNKHSVEAHIFDFYEDIYGSEVTIEFIDRLRGEKKFSDADELAEQIRKDVEEAKLLLRGI